MNDDSLSSTTLRYDSYHEAEHVGDVQHVLAADGDPVLLRRQVVVAVRQRRAKRQGPLQLAHLSFTFQQLNLWYIRFVTHETI